MQLRVGFPAALVAATASVAVGGQTFWVPTPDARMFGGTAVIRGHVVDQAGRPIPDATVLVSLDGGHSGRSVQTDPGGAYEVGDLPSRRYTVSARKAGFSGAFYGNVSSERGAPSAFELATGEVAGDVDMSMAEYASVSGRVLDDRGLPAAGVEVHVHGIRNRSGRRYVAPSGRRQVLGSDARFLFNGIPPGDYVLSTSSQSPRPDGRVEGAGAVARVPDWPTQFHHDPFGDGPRVMRVEPGAVVSDIEIRRVAVPAFDIRGRITGLPTEPHEVNASLLDAGSQPGIVSEFPVSRARLTPDGTFVFSAVPEGDYVIAVFAVPLPQTLPGHVVLWQSLAGGAGGFGPNVRRQPLAPMSNDTMRWARVPVSVRRADVEALDVPLARGARIRGVVTFDGAEPIPAGEELETVAMFLFGNGTPAIPRLQMARVERDGSFVTAGVPPGRYTLEVAPEHWDRRWSRESSSIDGRLVRVIEVESEDRTGVRLTYTDRPIEVAGTVLDQRGQPTFATPVYLFPTDRSTWTADAEPDVVRISRTTRRGAFLVTGLMPDEYYVKALLASPATLDLAAMANDAAIVRLGKGERQIVNLEAR